MPPSVLTRAPMTSFKSKRTWSRTRFTRPSSSTPSPTSPKQSSLSPSSPPSSQQQPSCHTQQQHSPEKSQRQHQPPPQQLQRNSAPTSPNQPVNQNPQALFLRQIRTLLSDFEQIHKVNQAPLTDSRILHIRHHIEKCMPRLYSLQQQMMNNSSSEAARALFLAENCLKHFPDVDDVYLRALHPHTQTKPAEPASTQQKHQARFPSLYSVPSSYSSKPPLHHATAAVNTNNMQSSSYYYSSKPPHMPSTITDHRPTLNTAQQMLLRTVNSLSSNHRQQFPQTWYEAPAALSPMEIATMSDAINRRMAFASSAPGPSATNSSGYAYGHAQYASHRDVDSMRYSAWDAVRSRHESSLYADAARSTSTTTRHRRSNSNDE